MADNAYNVTTQVRQIILETDLSIRDTLVQDNAAWDLERLHLESVNDIVKFRQSYITLAANTGRASLGPELIKKWFSKLIKSLRDLIYKVWID